MTASLYQSGSSSSATSREATGAEREVVGSENMDEVMVGGLTRSSRSRSRSGPGGADETPGRAPLPDPGARTGGGPRRSSGHRSTDRAAAGRGVGRAARAAAAGHRA